MTYQVSRIFLRCSLSSIFLFLLDYSLLYGQSDSILLPKQYQCIYTSLPITIDGEDKEGVWSKAPWTDEFVDIEGDKKPKPLYRTRTKMLWDKEHLYFFAALEEPHVWGTLTEDESVIYHDNDFEIFLDPNGDGHHYFEYEINALGTQWDLQLTKPYRSGGKVINHWQMTGLKKAIKIYGSLNDPSDTDEKWTIEIAIPWASLMEGTGDWPRRKYPEENELWRINFSRVQWRHTIEDGKYRKEINPKTDRSYPENNWVWSPQHAIDMHRPEHWGYLQFSKEKRGGRKELHLDEAIKQRLFQIYRAQLGFMKKNHRVATLEELQLQHFQSNQYLLQPILEKTAHLFEIRLKSPYSGKEWYINQEGLLRSSHKKKSF